MGVFRVELEVCNAEREEFVSVEAMVDTGATYTMFPEDLLGRLGVEPLESDVFELADESLVEYQVGDVVIRLQGRMRTAPVVFVRPGAKPLIGATTLEIFRLAVDPVHKRLIRARQIQARPL